MGLDDSGATEDADHMATQRPWTKWYWQDYFGDQAVEDLLVENLDYERRWFRTIGLVDMRGTDGVIVVTLERLAVHWRVPLSEVPETLNAFVRCGACQVHRTNGPAGHGGGHDGGLPSPQSTRVTEEGPPPQREAPSTSSGGGGAACLEGRAAAPSEGDGSETDQHTYPENAKPVAPGGQVRIPGKVRTDSGTYQVGAVAVGRFGGYWLPDDGLFEWMSSQADAKAQRVWGPGHDDRVEWRAR